jgi:ribosome-associated protein
MKLSKSDFKKLALKAAAAGDDKKAGGVRVLDLCGRSTLADFVVLMTVESPPQLEAVEEEISLRLKREGSYCLHRDGARSKTWKVLDYGGVLVHVLDARAAEFYAIDSVYPEAKPVEWRGAPAVPAKKPAPPRAKKTPARAAPKAPAKKKPALRRPAKKKAAGKASVRAKKK